MGGELKDLGVVIGFIQLSRREKRSFGMKIDIGIGTYYSYTRSVPRTTLVVDVCLIIRNFIHNLFIIRSSARTTDFLIFVHIHLTPLVRSAFDMHVHTKRIAHTHLVETRHEVSECTL